MRCGVQLFLEVQGRHDSQMWAQAHSSRPRPHAAMMHPSRYLSLSPTPVTISTRILRARCRKSKRVSPCARSAGTRARRMRRRPSARRDRSVRPCPLEWALPHCQAPDALRPIPTGLGRGKMHHNRRRGRSGQTRQPTWSRGGTRRRSRRCRATLEMELPCPKCQRCRRSTGTRARRESKDRREVRMGVR
jgi:hypothetical protein